jgi:hypothetical protein
VNVRRQGRDDVFVIATEEQVVRAGPKQLLAGHES